MKPNDLFGLKDVLNCANMQLGVSKQGDGFWFHRLVFLSSLDKVLL